MRETGVFISRRLDRWPHSRSTGELVWWRPTVGTPSTVKGVMPTLPALTAPGWWSPVHS